MASGQGLLRRAHFLGTKIRNLRKRNHLTLEDLSVRCIQIDRDSAPSVSYLSMIENGKRVPSESLLQVIAGIFQKDLTWFFDETLQEESVDTASEDRRNRRHSPGTGLPFFKRSSANRDPRIAGADWHDGKAVRAPADTRPPGITPEPFPGPRARRRGDWQKAVSTHGR
jgi:transcriptional regulator with XRE-family HTH domain